ncbi:MAG: YdbL family protein [Candidatus Didemnitutus sp.]|nr:YdbL family protein [Candidatus Didemnitutus sp.]
MMTRFLFLCLAVCTLAVATAHANSSADIRRRMEQRLPQIDDLKAKGALGENNRGYLEVRQATGDAASVTSDENRDREAVYGMIAQQTGASADSVGRARAKQIAAQSISGVWVQRENGEWYRK